MIDKLAEQLAERTPRERWMLALLLVVVLPAAAVWGIGLPMLERQDAALRAVLEAESLERWLAVQQAELAALPQQARIESDIPAPAPIGLSGVEGSLIDAGLRPALSLLASTTGNGLSLRFDAVLFVRLMPWLEQIQSVAGYAIADLQLRPVNGEGMVEAEVTLTPAR